MVPMSAGRERKALTDVLEQIRIATGIVHFSPKARQLRERI
jgi:hypothetical protein